MLSHVIEVTQPGFIDDPATGEGALRVTIEGGSREDVTRILKALIQQTQSAFPDIREYPCVFDGGRPYDLNIDHIDHLAKTSLHGIVITVGAWQHAVAEQVAA